MNRIATARSENSISDLASFFCGGLFAAIAVILAGYGGVNPALGAGLAAALALALMTQPRFFGPAVLRYAVFDALVIGAYAYLCNPAGVLWRAPASWSDLFAFTPVGAGCAAGLYIIVFLVIARYSGRRPTLPAALAVAFIPFLFCLFIALGSSLPVSIGHLATFHAPISDPVAAMLGRALLLLLLNEAIIAGAAIALGRPIPREASLQGALLIAAILAAATPDIASFGSSAFVADLPRPLSVIGMALCAALAQAGLWGETYLVTQAIADLLHGSPPIGAAVRKPWSTGLGKGAVYGFVFIGLVAGIGALAASPHLVRLLLAGGVYSFTLLGALLYPLGRAILESTDSTPPFFSRLSSAYRQPSNYLRGLALGAAIGFGVALGEAAWGSGDRFLFGFLAGACAYAGIDFFCDIIPILTRTRKRLSSWRVYLFGAVLGGVIGGAVAWYIDAGQLAVIAARFGAYTHSSYAGDHLPVAAYNVTLLFSKWGDTNLGLVEGGVKLLYAQSLSGVIKSIFAAPLFSINLFFLTALIKRDMKPLRALFSEEGLRQLVDNAIMVLRWGLWMAPIIDIFLKASPDPTWYNQDGLIRTGVASFMAASAPYTAFSAWSLEIFTALLAYDWLRVLIWFDHMGLRVATLVNLSFVGGDVADEKAARFLGKAQVSRVTPAGLRRFGTWAPLILPYYIPQGDNWDKAWVGAEKIQGSTPPALSLLMGYLIVVGIAALTLAGFSLRRLSVAGRVKQAGTGIATTSGAKPFVLTNGLLTSEWYDDGQSFSRVESAARIGPPIDLTRRPDDPGQPRGKFFYFREGDGALWSLGAAPVFGAGDTHLQRVSPTRLFLAHTWNGIRVEATVEVVEGEAVEITRLKLVNLERRPRHIMVASLREWVVNETGVERRDAAYNAIHVGTWFMRSPTAIIAQNRLLKTPRSGHGDRRLSPEVAFHAAGPGPTGVIKLLGYEDMKSRFFGLASVSDPGSLTTPTSPRAVEDQGLLYGFEPCASLRYEARLAPESTTEIVFVDGWAPDFAAAAISISKHLNMSAPDEADIAAIQKQQRTLLPAPCLTQGGVKTLGAARAVFSADGRLLTTEPGTPRPFAHVIANAFGEGAVMTNDGDIFSFSVNARQNSLTPFRMGEGRNGPLGQTIYVRDLVSGDVDCPTFLPLRRGDGDYSVDFGLGYGVFIRRRVDLELELTIFNPPDKTCEVKLLRLINKGAADRIFSVSQISEIILAETAVESQGALQIESDPAHCALFFRNPKNDFVRGWAFAATSLNADCMETSRRRAFGPRAKLGDLPYMVEHGHADAGSPSDQRIVAAFSGAIEVKAGGEALVSFVLGQTGTLEDARRFAEIARNPDWACQALVETKQSWDGILGVLRIETNKPDFDRLVNDWLPYQLLVARLWGRTGPVQRSGATGYRDQLQDVLPLILLAPGLAKRQILLHAARQFIEGDAVKWWHTAPGGGTGLADRTRSSDPHLWLAYVTLRYVEATGDEAAFDADAAFIEGDAVPRGQEGQASVPLPSRESASLFDHCRLAVDWTLKRFGAHGLPLMGTGDWDDGMDLVGFKGRGESVWVGFFLHGILIDFARVCEKRGHRKYAERYRDAAERLRAALDACWRGDRYLRAYADDGREIAPMSAMTASWPVLSRAVDFSRGVEVVEQALAVLGRPDRILLVSPSYNEHSDPFPGRSAEYPPGVRENGGQYSHGSSWFVDALAQLAEMAAKSGDKAEARRLYAKAFETWVAISPLSKYGDAASADIYGLPPHQQPADVYEGPGYAGRGGWSWYTGSAARMMVGAYAMLGLKLDGGEFSLALDAFEPKGDLTLRKVVYRGRVYESDVVKPSSQ